MIVSCLRVVGVVDNDVWKWQDLWGILGQFPHVKEGVMNPAG